MHHKLTLREVSRDLSQSGLTISSANLANGIASGIYPFGTVLNIGETGRRTFQILRVDYENWKEKVIFNKKENQVTPTHCPSPSNNTSRKLLSAHSYTVEQQDIVWEVTIQCWEKNPTGADK